MAKLSYLQSLRKAAEAGKAYTDSAVQAADEELRAYADGVAGDVADELAAYESSNNSALTTIRQDCAKKIESPSTAMVGYVLAVESVDAKGAPTKWKTVQQQSGGGSGGGGSYDDTIIRQLIANLDNATYQRYPTVVTSSNYASNLSNANDALVSRVYTIDGTVTNSHVANLPVYGTGMTLIVLGDPDNMAGRTQLVTTVQTKTGGLSICTVYSRVYNGGWSAWQRSVTESDLSGKLNSNLGSNNAGGILTVGENGSIIFNKTLAGQVDDIEATADSAHSQAMSNLLAIGANTRKITALENAGFMTASEADDTYEATENKVTVVDEESDNDHYPTAKAVYDAVYYSLNEQTMTETTATIKPDIFYKWGTVTELHLTMAAAIPDHMSEFMFQFESGTTPTVLDISGVTWVREPTIEANKTYQASILNGIGVIVGV